jgi:hypothetical protein
MIECGRQSAIRHHTPKAKGKKPAKHEHTWIGFDWPQQQTAVIG